MAKGIKLYKSENNLITETCLEEVTKDTTFDDKTWIDLSEPTQEVLEKISKETSIPLHFLICSLDEEETARIDYEDESTLIVLDVPCINKDTDEIYTKPFIITYNNKFYVTISRFNDTLINTLLNKTRNIEPHKKIRLTLNLVYQLSKEFIYYLKKIDMHTKDVENRLQNSMKNREIFELMDLNKTLVYFSTALNADKAVLNKLLKSTQYKKYEEDFDLMEDTEVELNQAIEMCSIYRNILAGMMDTFASVISNNLNIVMKTLTVITIVISIPTLVSSIYGMNFDKIPLSKHEYGFWIILAFAFVLAIIGAIILMILTSNKNRRK